VTALRIPGDFGVKPPIEGKPGAQGAPKTPKSRRPTQGDRVEISDTSKSLRADTGEQAQRAEAPRSGDAPSKKQATVQDRIASGFYNREEVINHIAKRILDLLGFK
jgi:hypothetical protein